jgi:hypothetical protein
MVFKKATSDDFSDAFNSAAPDTSSSTSEEQEPDAFVVEKIVADRYLNLHNYLEWFVENENFRSSGMDILMKTIPGSLNLD